MRVPPEGPLEATIAFVGEGPGSDELRLCRPFVGKSGYELDSLLNSLGLSRNQVYLTNVEKTTALKPDFDRQVVCGVELVREFQAMPNLNCIVALGEIAMNTLGAWKYLATKIERGQVVTTPEGAITRWRGSVLETFFGLKMIPTYHPAFYMRGQTKFKSVVQCDMRRALEQSAFRDLRRPQRTFHIEPSYVEAIEWLHSLENSPDLAVDIETFGWGWGQTFINCIGFAPTPYEAFCIPIMRQGRAPYWTLEQEVHIFRALQRVFASCKRTWLQNGMFDIWILNEHGLKVRNFFHDIMLSHHLLYPELPHGLDFICSIYSEEPYYKDEGKSWSHSQPMKQLWEYNCKDCCVTLEAGLQLEQEVAEAGMTEYFHDYIMPLVWPLMEMQRVGIRVDPERLERLKTWLTCDLEVRQNELNAAAGFAVNVKSPKDMERLLTAQGIRITQKTKTGQPKLDEDSIREYCRQAAANKGQNVTVGDEALKIRGLRTLLSNFVDIAVDEENMYHFSLLIHGTRTGRLSSRAPQDSNGDPLGPQMQNIPHDVRGVFCAAPGKIFVSGDLKQAEAMDVAWRSGDAAMMQVFINGEDIHRFNGAASFSKPAELITYDERQIAKRLTHGFDYGMGARRAVGVCAGIGYYVTERFCENVRQGYFRKCPGVPLWQERTIDQVQRTKELTDAFGRRRVFLGSFDSKMANEALAQNPQSDVAGITNRSIITLYEILPSHARVVLQVHDEVLVECDADKWLEVARLMNRAMRIPMRFPAGELTIPVEIKVGPFWHDGMKEVAANELELNPEVPDVHQET